MKQKGIVKIAALIMILSTSKESAIAVKFAIASLRWIGLTLVKKGELQMSWIVGNGAGTQWRIWEGGSPSWTRFKNKATRFARRVDAEAVHAEDEDAWTVIELEELVTGKTPSEEPVAQLDIGEFKPCIAVNEELGITEAIFEDVPYIAEPVFSSVYHYIDKHIAVEDGRLVGMTVWSASPVASPAVAPVADAPPADNDGLKRLSKSLNDMCDDNEELREYVISLETRNWWQRLFNVGVQS